MYGCHDILSICLSVAYFTVLLKAEERSGRSIRLTPSSLPQPMWRRPLTPFFSQRRPGLWPAILSFGSQVRSDRKRPSRRAARSPGCSSPAGWTQRELGPSPPCRSGSGRAGPALSAQRAPRSASRAVFPCQYPRRTGASRSRPYPDFGRVYSCGPCLASIENETNKRVEGLHSRAH